MNDTNSSNTTGWYTRPIFSVSSMVAALHHYRDLLGFESKWNHDEGGENWVEQVDKGSLELILTSNMSHVGTGRLFVSLTEDELLRLHERIKQHQIKYESFFWGYKSIGIKDPDGNQLIIPEEG